MPFVGLSGRILDYLISIVPHQFSYVITNTVCCRPQTVVYLSTELEDEAPDINKLHEGEDYEIHDMNREPQLPEIEACRSHIDEIVEDFKPHGIVYLGEVAKSYKTSLPTLSLYHPAYIARLEYKLLTVNKQSRKLELFIERLVDATI